MPSPNATPAPPQHRQSRLVRAEKSRNVANAQQGLVGPLLFHWGVVKFRKGSASRSITVARAGHGGSMRRASSQAARKLPATQSWLARYKGQSALPNATQHSSAIQAGSGGCLK